MKKTLTNFDLQELERLMNELGAEPRIFNSEAQFQFELAWKIKEVFDCEVRLELLSHEYSTTRNYRGKEQPYIKHEYTDIILEKEDISIALELKYKTAKRDQYHLKNQGATDLGSYDFLWDVHRLQILTGLEKGGNVLRPCQRGFAIILTNDAVYWNKASQKREIDKDFFIDGDEKGCGTLTKGEHRWCLCDGSPGIPKTVKDTFRQNEIDLKKDYNYVWREYCNLDKQEKNNEFKYMIVSV